MKIATFLEQLALENTMAPGTHNLAAPLEDGELAAWKAANLALRIPDQLMELLSTHNGFTLRSDKESPVGGAIRFLPLREIQYAPRLMFAGSKDNDDKFPREYVALTEDSDSTYFVILDTASGRYMVMDPIDPEPEHIFDQIDPLLDWILSRSK